MNVQLHPKITIVTPSFNQGHYLEDTILSVLGQGYPNLEYFIIDGGSTDNSVEIITKYETKLAYWQSDKDRGQSDAINQGFQRATGDVVGWLNSDDMYLPGTLHYIAQLFIENTDEKHGLNMLFGNCIHLRESQNVAKGSDVGRLHRTMDLELFDYIIQPSCFWTKRVNEVVGPLNENLHYAFDWDWFIRAKRAGVQMLSVDRFLSVYRVHETRKTGTGGDQRLQELSGIYEEYSSREIADGFIKYKESKTIDLIIKLIHGLHLNKIIDPSRLIYNLYFRSSFSWKTFDNIRRM